MILTFLSQRRCRLAVLSYRMVLKSIFEEFRSLQEKELRAAPTIFQFNIVREIG